MENPRTINRFVVAFLIAVTTAAVAMSIYHHNVYFLLVWLAAVAAFFVICFAFAFFNIAVFAPLFRLIARIDTRLTGRRPPKR